jgi:prevent-host-death family protein
LARIERITPSEAKRKLASVLNTVEYGRKAVVFERHGREIAALIPMELYAMVRELLQELEDEDDWGELQRALADPENAVPLAWDSNRYGKSLQPARPAHGRQEPAAGNAAHAAKAARRHRGARR